VLSFPGIDGSVVDDVPIVHVDNFSYGLLNPVLGYLMSCLGACAA
jgi:hypothetical protein